MNLDEPPQWSGAVPLFLPVTAAKVTGTNGGKIFLNLAGIFLLRSNYVYGGVGIRLGGNLE